MGPEVGGAEEEEQGRHEAIRRWWMNQKHEFRHTWVSSYTIRDQYVDRYDQKRASMYARALASAQHSPG